MDQISYLLDQLDHTFVFRFMLSPVYIAATLALATIVWAFRDKPETLGRFLFPREIYRHASTWVDIKIALFNTLVSVTGVFSALVFTPLVTFVLLEGLGGWWGSAQPAPNTLAGSLAAGVVLLLANDFARFLNHYLHHSSAVLWPFHAVHHSAQVMTPITFLRAHPLYSVFQVLIKSVLIGAAQAGALFLLIGRVDFYVIYVTTLAFNAYIFFGGHLRHSHIWLSFGPVLEHVVISPAQHQIHHSTDPRHFDKNFGEILAIWDWMFGTLYVTRGRETLVFGLADAEGQPLDQPYPSLRAAMIGPFAEAWHEILRGTSRDPERAGTGPGGVTDRQ